MDAVYFVRLLSRSESMAHASEELRHSLRSLAANAPGVTRVWIVGGANRKEELPGWLDPSAIRWHPGARPLRQADSNQVRAWDDVKHLNTWAQWMAMAEMAAGGMFGAEFAIMNDDFYVMERLDPLVNEHRGQVKLFAEARRFAGLASMADMMERTAAWVEREIGTPAADQVAYETHGPLVVPAAGFASVMHLADQAMRGGIARLAKRSLVGNALRLLAVEARDGKVHGNDDPVPAGRYLSSSDAAFKHGNRPGQIGRVIRRAFPDRCRFER